MNTKFLYEITEDKYILKADLRPDKVFGIERQNGFYTILDTRELCYLIDDDAMFWSACSFKDAPIIVNQLGRKKIIGSPGRVKKNAEQVLDIFAYSFVGYETTIEVYQGSDIHLYTSITVQEESITKIGEIVWPTVLIKIEGPGVSVVDLEHMGSGTPVTAGVSAYVKKGETYKIFHGTYIIIWLQRLLHRPYCEIIGNFPSQPYITAIPMIPLKAAPAGKEEKINVLHQKSIIPEKKSKK